MKGNSFRLESYGLEQDFDELKILTWTKGGTTVCIACGPPFGIDYNFKQSKNLFFKWKKCKFFSWKEIVSIGIGRFRARFWWVKILTWTKGGTTVSIACGPPFGIDYNFKQSKILFFKWKKCKFFSWKEIVLDWNRTVWSKILMSENSDMDQRGDHSIHCMWSPLWYWLKLQTIQKLVF